jgi:hypothetical protein
MPGMLPTRKAESIGAVEGLFRLAGSRAALDDLVHERDGDKAIKRLAIVSLTPRMAERADRADPIPATPRQAITGRTISAGAKVSGGAAAAAARARQAQSRLHRR